jgi:cytochrome c peroxidase
MTTTMRASISVASLALVAACTGGDGLIPVGSVAQGLSVSDVTSRIPNPPLLSDRVELPGDLRGRTIPEPPQLGQFVKDRAAAIALGKALFWDMQVGADGVQACASCHFRAGADPRSKNQISPGLKAHPDADLSFSTGGPNHQLTADDFPLSRLAVAGTRGALDPASDSNDAVSSQGVHHLALGQPDPEGFAVNGKNTRRVEPRNTPSVINAVFNHRQFWDGRAENVFNGINHVGARDPSAKVVRADDPWVHVETTVALTNASLASQAVAPIVSTLEMAQPGDTTQTVARRLAKQARQVGNRVLKARPLANQVVHAQDSVLGPYSRSPKAGLTIKSYEDMIEAAFHRQWWDSYKMVSVDANGNVSSVFGPDNDPTTDEYWLMQYNFALFFGIAVQLYQTTLIADDTPWDRFRRQVVDPNDPLLNPWVNTDPEHISHLALIGAHLFNDRARGPTNIRCSNCHEQAELTDASVRRIGSNPVRNRDGNVIDRGFNNIGVRPTADDLGAGASDAFGALSFTRRLFPGAAPSCFPFLDPCPTANQVTKGFGVQGAFKIPSLRNVALTAPYFHNGDARTLREVVELYSRGGNVAPVTELDGTIIEPLGVPQLTTAEIDAIVAFLETLTDERVLYRRAPFDHPQLFVPNGHPGDEASTVDANGDGLADDVMLEISAVGAQGGAPLPGFLEGPFGP